MTEPTPNPTGRPKAPEFDVLDLRNNPTREDRFDKAYRSVVLALLGGALIAGFIFM